MNLELFIAKKIHFRESGEKRVSPPAVRIATIGIALGLAVMILSVAIVVGFKKEVRNKVIGFGSHIQITHFDENNSYDMNPIMTNDSLLLLLNQTPGVAHVQRFATKPGIIKLDNEFQGIVLKGISREFDWSFFSKHLQEGKLFSVMGDSPSNEVMISSRIANKLNLKVGDSFLTYFVEKKLRVRKFHISGIYRTNFTEYDNVFVLADMRHINKLNNWSENFSGGIEITAKEYDQLENTAYSIYEVLNRQNHTPESAYYVRTIRELHPQIFSWLELLDMNVWIILILMISVAGFTMISGLLIIILERTNMIGILKAMGANNASIRKVFLYVSFFLIGRGMIWGNIIGLSLCFLQKFFSIVSLDPEVYYLTAVPIDLNPLYFILLNLCSLVLSMLMLVGPSYLIAKIRPAESIRFE